MLVVITITIPTQINFNVIQRNIKTSSDFVLLLSGSISDLNVVQLTGQGAVIATGGQFSSFWISNAW